MCDTKKVLLNFHVLKFSYNYIAAEKTWHTFQLALEINIYICGSNQNVSSKVKNILLAYRLSAPLIHKMSSN